MWVTKLLISPVKKRIFCPKTTKFSPKLAFLAIAGSFGALSSGWLVVEARAVTRKTPTYFITTGVPAVLKKNTAIIVHVGREVLHKGPAECANHGNWFTFSENQLWPISLGDQEKFRSMVKVANLRLHTQFFVPLNIENIPSQITN